MGPDARQAGPEARLCVRPDGVRSGALDPTRPGKARRVVTHPRPAQAGEGSGDCRHQYAVAECLSGYSRHLQLGVSERGERQTHGELGLFFGHDRRPDRGQADGPRDAAGLAPAGHGLKPAGRRLQQRLRVRVSELPLMVVADNPASVRGASASRLRAPVRRGRQCGRPPRCAAQSDQPA